MILLFKFDFCRNEVIFKLRLEFFMECLVVEVIIVFLKSVLIMIGVVIIIFWMICVLNNLEEFFGKLIN